VFKVSVERATATGLTYRPIADTVRDTLAWLTTNQPTDSAKDVAPIELPVGLSPEREAALLQAWRQREAHHNCLRDEAGNPPRRVF
jgi:2'-hydroxyisoflavone reductase